MNSTSEAVSYIHFLDYNPNGHPVVLLLHGLGVDGSSWGYQIPELCQEGFRPIAPDLPGFGKSSFPAERWSIKNTARAMAGLLSRLHVQSAVVAGISMGGTIALQLALDFPAVVEKLVLINTFACLRPKRISEMAYLASRFAVANLRGKNYQSQMVARRLFPNPEQAELRNEIIECIKQADPRAYRAAMLGLGLFNVRHRLADILAPTLIMSGAEDSTVGLACQDELARGIPGARHVIIPKAGHAVIADQPAQFNQAFIQFIRENGASAEQN